MKYKPRVIGRPSSSSCNLTIFSQTCSAMERRSDSLENYNKGQQNLVTEGSGHFADSCGLTAKSSQAWYSKASDIFFKFSVWCSNTLFILSKLADLFSSNISICRFMASSGKSHSLGSLNSSSLSSWSVLGCLLYALGWLMKHTDTTEKFQESISIITT